MIDKTTADELTAKACTQLDTGIKYRQPRLDDILKAEELYFNRKTKTLKARFNIPIPIMSGFVDTLTAKIDDEITINYDPTEDADKMKAKKVGGAWKYDSAPTRGMWAIKDILVKKLAIFSGRGIYKFFGESYPRYCSYFEIVDAFDFIAEPSGGWHLENHIFCGQENIFKTEAELKAGVESGIYSNEQVEILISKTSSGEFKVNEEQYRNRTRRLEVLGLDVDTNNYVGDKLFNLVEWAMTTNGKRYYLLFERKTGVWVRCVPLEEITGKVPEGKLPSYPWKSWATHYDYWNFWSKAPVDDVRPLAEGMKIITNFMFDDVQKKLWGQRIFDAEIITDPSQLEWDRPDKLIEAVLPAGKKLSDGVYEFQTGDNSSMTINLVDYFRNMIGTETGVTPQQKGNSDEKLLGIAKINEGEVADRLGLYNKFYVQCYAEIGLAYLYSLKANMDETMLVRMIGENGTESHEITREDLEFTSEPDIRITGGKSEARKSEILQQKKEASLLASFQIAPELFNRKLVVESTLLNGSWEADEISALMDVTAEGSEEESVRASQALQDLLNGKKLDLYLGATDRFLHKIIQFASRKKLTSDQRMRILQYGMAHRDIVIKNKAMKLQLEMATAAANPALAGQEGAQSAGRTDIPAPQPIAPAEVTPQ